MNKNCLYSEEVDIIYKVVATINDSLTEILKCFSASLKLNEKLEYIITAGKKPVTK